jgi:hypothetical protein
MSEMQKGPHEGSFVLLLEANNSGYEDGQKDGRH